MPIRVLLLAALFADIAVAADGPTITNVRCGRLLDVVAGKYLKNAKVTLLAGFTTIRNLGADEYSDIAIRDGIAAGDIDGPRMLVSGPALGITGGHCDENLLPFEYHRVYEGVADGPWAARAKVR